jgi:signal transduction histidine kinase
MNFAGVKILLVEDSPSDAALLQESLAQNRPGAFEFTIAESWAQAADQLRRGKFDVVLLDLTLPDSTSRDTFLRARHLAPLLPIIVLSGITDEALAVDALRHGIQDYLIKGQHDGLQTARAIRYAIERNRIEIALKETEAALRESDCQLRALNQDLERRVALRTAELEEVITDLEDYSHSITHDLRAPLRAMRAFGEILQQECATSLPADAQEHLRLIVSSAARMDKLILDILQYSRLARSEVKLEPIELVPLLEGIIASYPALQPGKADIRIDGTLPRVLGNEAALTQCCSNLLENAVKFVAPDVRPLVRIWAEAKPPQAQLPEGPVPATRDSVPPEHLVRLCFADNGIGIPQEAQDRIFKLFQRLDKGYAGTGVGLTVVRKAVEKMGGRIGLKSEPGHGSCFWLELSAAAG